MKHILLFLSFLVLISCNDLAEVKTLQGNALGTTYSIKYFSDETIRPLEIDSILKVINSSMSTYVEDSDISKINSGDTTIVVDTHFKKVYKASQRIYKATNGYFDPSVGVLVNAYGFGPGGYSDIVTDEEFDSLHQLIGFDKIQLTADSKITFDSSISYIDFNAIAKGYTVDVFADFIQSKGVENFLVEIGGEVSVMGQNLNNQSPWKIGIEMPLEGGSRELEYGVNLYNQSLATSGNYRKFRIDSTTGQKYVHTINPKTGKSQKSDVLSASVIADSCTDADAFATAFMAMGFVDSKKFLETNERLKVILIYSDQNGNQKTFISEDLQDSVEKF